MCGIYCRCRRDFGSDSDSDSDSDVKTMLARRGPDATDSRRFEDETWSVSVEMEGHTLWTRGPGPVRQPTGSDKGALLFNGDLFPAGRSRDDDDNDTLLLHSLLERGDALAVLRRLRGPFALVYLDREASLLYFCRDRLGRRSLLADVRRGELTLSSVFTRRHRTAREVPVGSVHRLRLREGTVEEIPWDGPGPLPPSSPEAWLSRLRDGTPGRGPAPPPPSGDAELVASLERHAGESRDGSDFLRRALGTPALDALADRCVRLLSESVRVRTRTQPGRCAVCVGTPGRCAAHATVGVLFSGGLDCTLLAALASRHLPPDETVDLLNVAFDRKGNGSYDTPDRLRSRRALVELERTFPERRWNLIEIDVPEAELAERRRETIADLIHPLATVLDEGLGCALWFAARGRSDAGASACRILLTGTGADELFGGYSRHRIEFRRGGWPGLERELDRDWRRIARRNLGRDDRVTGSHGRQPRAPYLDEGFVEFVLGLRPWERCFPDGTGCGDKLLLRVCALKAGLEETATAPKRAIQFGSRMALSKENGRDVSLNLLND